MKERKASIHRLSVMLVLLILAMSLCVSAVSQKRSGPQGKPLLKKRAQASLSTTLETTESPEPTAPLDNAFWHHDKEEEEDDDDGSDCDNGNDDDDGSQWHVKANEETSTPTQTPLSNNARTEFPQWLTDITKLSEWPGHNPPYIAQDHIDMSDIPYAPIRALGDCAGIDASYCSFDCHRCVTGDDISTCPLISQTFDDGPGPATPKLLEALPGKTTFFTQGMNVIRFPDTFRQQHAHGHLLASHTWSHPNLAGLRNEEIAAQIQWSIWAMNATAGIVPLYFRPPYGASDNRVRAVAKKFGLISVFWDHDTYDWKVNEKKKTSKDVEFEVRAWKKIQPQGLLLEHDSTMDVVNVGIEVANILAENGGRQMTVAECVNGNWYQNL